MAYARRCGLINFVKLLYIFVTYMSLLLCVRVCVCVSEAGTKPHGASYSILVCNISGHCEWGKQWIIECSIEATEIKLEYHEYIPRNIIYIRFSAINFNTEFLKTQQEMNSFYWGDQWIPPMIGYEELCTWFAWYCHSMVVDFAHIP